MKLNEAIFTILLKEQLKKGVGSIEDILYEKKDDSLVFKRKYLIDMANDIADEFDKNSKDVILD